MSEATEQKILDISRRLAQGLAEARRQNEDDKLRFAQELEAEREKLNEEVQMRQREVDAVRLRMEHEQRQMDAVSRGDEEVVTLNVGGEIFSTLRSTLCQFEDSYLANLFSGRWESSIERDSEGRRFLDFDPACFRILLGFLRDKRLETAGHPAPPLVVPPEKEEQFSNLAEYLDMSRHLRSATAEELEPPRPQPQPTLGQELLGSASAFFSALSSATATAAAATSAAASRHGVDTIAPGPDGRPSLLNRGGLSLFGGSADTTAGHKQSASSSSQGYPQMLPVHKPPLLSKEEPPKKAGWSKKTVHRSCIVDSQDTGTVSISDTRKLASAAAVRSTRGYQAGKHYWQIDVQQISDWSYVGFVAEHWSSVSLPVGRAPQSWGVASNGVVYKNREELAKLTRYSSGSYVGFLIDLDDPKRTAAVVIDGNCYQNVFTDLPAIVYPAVSNCRSAAKYTLTCDIGLPPGLTSATASAL